MKSFSKINLPLSIALVLAFNVIGCQQKTDVDQNQTPKDTLENSSTLREEQTQVRRALYAEMIQDQTFNIKANETSIFTTENGMKVEIPAGSLVDEKGKTVKGKVDIVVQEYYSAADIILSGIPMGYNDGKTTHSFESDGMFTISAVQKDKQLKIAEGKSIQASMQRRKAGDDFAFYQLNGEQWALDEENEIAAFDPGDLLPVLTRPERPNIPTPLTKFNPNYYTIEKDHRYQNTDMQSDKAIDYVTQIDLDINENPWILDKKLWKYSKRVDHWIFKKRPSTPVTYDTIKFRKIQAVRGTNTYKKLQKELDNYDKALAAYEENYEARRAAGQLTTSEEVKLTLFQLGTHNIDRYYKFPPRLLADKPYKIINEEIQSNVDAIYLIVKSNNGIIPVDLTMYPNQLRFNKIERNAIIALVGEDFYGLDENSFEKTVKSQKNDKLFKLDIEKLTFADAKSFNNKLEGLF